MDLKLRGKVVLVTGSSRGIGLATAKGFAVEGSRIMLSARSTVAAHGGIEILVNNVGGGAHIADSSDDDGRGALERKLIQTGRMMRLVAAACDVGRIRRGEGGADLRHRATRRRRSP